MDVACDAKMQLVRQKLIGAGLKLGFHRPWACPSSAPGLLETPPASPGPLGGCVVLEGFPARSPFPSHGLSRTVPGKPDQAGNETNLISSFAVEALGLMKPRPISLRRTASSPSVWTCSAQPSARGNSRHAARLAARPRQPAGFDRGPLSASKASLCAQEDRPPVSSARQSASLG